MRIEFIRKSKDPKKWCQSDRAIFTKDFKSVEEAVKWYANAYKSCYIWGFRKEWKLKLRGQFFSKLISLIGEVNIPQYAEDYWKYIKENNYD